MRNFKILFVIAFFLVTNFSISQNIDDIKEYISIQIDTYNPIRSYDNYAMFKNDIIDTHVEVFAGEKVEYDVYENIFIYGVEAHKGEDLNGEIWLTEAQTIDLRAINKITTVRVPDKNRFYYKIILHLKDGYLRKKYSQSFDNPAKISRLESLNILIADNNLIAKKIKIAFIDLGKRIGVNIEDGDYY